MVPSFVLLRLFCIGEPEDTLWRPNGSVKPSLPAACEESAGGYAPRLDRSSGPLWVFWAPKTSMTPEARSADAAHAMKAGK